MSRRKQEQRKHSLADPTALRSPPKMPSLLFLRDITSDVDGVKNTLSSWDACMSKTYCKWPVIVAIIAAALICLSLIWCLARCLCCGAECCCACFSCCNSCCPSPSRRGRRNQGYQQAPPMVPPPQYSPYGAYQSPHPPTYAPAPYSGYRAAPQTATFDQPSKTVGPYNEDALPAMPSWNNASTRHVEAENVEMENVGHDAAAVHPSAHQQYDPQQPQAYIHEQAPYHSNQDNLYHPASDLGTTHTSPYHEDSAYGHGYDLSQQPPPPAANHYQTYDQQAHQTFSPVSPISATAPAPMYQTRPPSSVYTAAPSYRTYAPSVAHPNQQQGQFSPVQAQPPVAIGRRPVEGSWRDV